MIDDGRPIFLQVAELIENRIIDGSLAEGDQAPSTNALALFERINPATAGKGIAMLVDAGVLYKRRGVGMFVAEGARDRLLAERRQRFAAEFVEPLVAESRKLGIHPSELLEMIRKETRA